jgi:hypothetical protein
VPYAQPPAVLPPEPGPDSFAAEQIRASRAAAPERR